MKLIIAGSRDYHFDITTIQNLVDVFIPEDQIINEIVSGRCRGIDKSGENWAAFQNIPIKSFPYKSEFGKSGGPLRNKEMAKYADALLLIWDSKSPGSASMKKCMIDENKLIYEVVLKS